ncbi:hypothetical protein GKZ89_03130 [Bacillus mangrovi]|uniref:Amyloid fiber anchoring/assembly protein TapA n=1 Tax=Metabacillus mangrovi TaxID=1491830 RepID=A0A7X2S411_9BACI|nr:hypothetical protein [Metabacillus mangrovi]MTH52386.1 hypothetical protein [Metabacillus mangrovi]
MKLTNTRVCITGFTAAVLLGTVLTFSPVKAYFNKTAEQEMGIQMGTWWDGSRLAFTELNQNGEDSCDPVTLTFPIENSGFEMIDSTTFQVFKDGERVEKGTLEKIAEHGKEKVSITVKAPGTYHAEADQRPGYEGSSTPVKTVSEKAVIAECPGPEEEQHENAPATDQELQNSREAENEPAADKEAKNHNGEAENKTDGASETLTEEASEDKVVEAEKQHKEDSGEVEKEG